MRFIRAVGGSHDIVFNPMAEFQADLGEGNPPPTTGQRVHLGVGSSQPGVRKRGRHRQRPTGPHQPLLHGVECGKRFRAAEFPINLVHLGRFSLRILGCCARGGVFVVARSLPCQNPRCVKQVLSGSAVDERRQYCGTGGGNPRWRIGGDELAEGSNGIVRLCGAVGRDKQIHSRVMRLPYRMYGIE